MYGRWLSMDIPGIISYQNSLTIDVTSLPTNLNADNHNFQVFKSKSWTPKNYS
jgi:hypothetical protein